MPDVDTLLAIMLIVLVAPPALQLAAMAMSRDLRRSQIARWRSDETSRILHAHAARAQPREDIGLGTRAERQRTRASIQIGRAKRIRASVR